MYLIFMLWSGAVPSDQSSTRDWYIENVNKYSISGVYGLNVAKLKEDLHLKPFKRKTTKLFPSVIQKIQQDLLPKQVPNRLDLAKRVNKVLIRIDEVWTNDVKSTVKI